MNSYRNASIQPGTKILFATFPADGHVNPLTGLAVHLKELGCDVRWYTSVTYEQKITKLGIPFFPLRKALDVSGDIEAVFPERRHHKSQVSKLRYDLINAFTLRAPEYYADIADLYHEFPFELMIADITFGGIPFVKEKMNIPVIGVSIIPLIETSKDLPPAGLGLTPSYTRAGRIKQHVMRWITNKMIFGKPTKVMRGLMAQHGIDTGKENVFDVLIHKSTVVLQSGTPSFEYKRTDMSANIYFAGPLLPYALQQNGSSWSDARLRRYKKVILVTQGTVEKDSGKLIIPTLEAFKDTDRLVVVTTGGSRTAELRARYPQDNIIIEDFIPFNDVMPYADVYVTNGGYGGVLLSVRNGLPMVVGGVHEGKNEINARVGYFGLGVNMKTEKPQPAQIRNAVEEVLNNPSYAERVQTLRQEFDQYDPAEVCAEQVRRLLAQSARPRQSKKASVAIY